MKILSIRSFLLLGTLSLGVVVLPAMASSDHATTLPSHRPNFSPWYKEAVYEKGDTVRYLGRSWVAKWWTQGDRPNKDKESGPWKPLSLIGGNGHVGDLTKPNKPNNIARYQVGTRYEAGDRVVGQDRRIYRCKAWPATPWCQQDAYAPGVSQHWKQAWVRVL